MKKESKLWAVLSVLIGAVIVFMVLESIFQIDPQYRSKPSYIQEGK